MDFLVYSRAAAGAAERDDPALDEAHWSYMDRFAGSMIARGPTLAPDRETFTGSLHVLGLPDPDAARQFVEDEPYDGAGIYEQHSVWRFDNLLGRTMWEFPREPNEPRFLVLAIASAPDGVVPVARLPLALRERLILYGALCAAESGAVAGIALAVQAPTRASVASLAEDALVQLGDRSDVAVHDWEFGGRR